MRLLRMTKNKILPVVCAAIAVASVSFSSYCLGRQRTLARFENRFVKVEHVRWALKGRSFYWKNTYHMEYFIYETREALDRDLKEKLNSREFVEGYSNFEISRVPYWTYELKEFSHDPDEVLENE